jgi:hypothetical protein
MKLNLYIHRAKVRATISKATPFTQNTFGDLLSLNDDKFVIHQSANQRILTLIIDVVVNGKEKHWARLYFSSGVLYIDSKLSISLIDEFIKKLRDKGIFIVLSKFQYRYLEICCRYPKKHFKKVEKAIKKLASNYETNITRGVRRTIKNNEEYLYLEKNLHNEKYFNLKTYRFIEKDRTSRAYIDDMVPPKLEIQICNPDTLEKAFELGIPVLRSILSSLNIKTIRMNKPYDHGDYKRIQNANTYSHSPKASFVLAQPTAKIFFISPVFNTVNNKLNCRLLSLVSNKGLNRSNILTQLGCSESTLTRSLRLLGKSVEKRGSKTHGFIYQTDVTKLLNI